MPIAIHSQINTTSTGLTTSSGWITVGFSPNGWFADGIGAVRFQLPEDFSGSETIYSATLSINASANGGSGSWCKTWIGIISGAQVLPADYMGLSSASTRAPQRILGGYTSDGVDATVSGTKTVLNLSLTDAFLAAQSDGALSSGYVVILFYPHSNNGGASHQIDGLGSGTPATLTFEYAEPGPPLDPEEEPIENAQTRSQGDTPTATYIVTATPTDGLTRSVGGPVAATVTLTAPAPQPGQTRSAGDAPEAVEGLSAVIEDAMTRSVGDAPAATSEGGWLDRPLFPTGLFPAGAFA